MLEYQKRLDGAAPLVPASPDASLITAKECAELCEKAGVAYKEGDEKRVLKFAISDDTQDRDGDVVKQGDAWDFAEYLKNPVVLFGHNRAGLPLGSTIDLQFKSFGRMARNGTERLHNQLVATALYDGAHENKLARTVFSMASRGLLKGASVGFKLKSAKSLKWLSPVAKEDADEMERLGMDRPGKVLSGQYLMEWSNVTIPANAGALRVAMAGESPDQFIKSAGGQVFDLQDDAFATCKAEAIAGYAAKPADPVEAAYLKTAFAPIIADPLDAMNALPKAWLLSRGVPCGSEPSAVAQMIGDLKLVPAPEKPAKSAEECLIEKIESDLKRLFAGYDTRLTDVDKKLAESSAKAADLAEKAEAVLQTGQTLATLSSELKSLISVSDSTESSSSAQTGAEELPSDIAQGAKELFEGILDL